MTVEMIRAITESEEKANEIKRAATDKSAQILADADKQAIEVEKACVERLKAYKETELKNAKAEAENRYNEALSVAKKDAREYCANILKNAEVCVSEIVGRIVRGDC